MKGNLELLLLWLFSAGWLHGQSHEPVQLRARVDLVSLDVDVRDREGNHVGGLAATEFVLKENGKAVEVAHFVEHANRSVSLVFVLDTSGMTRQQMIVAKQYISRISHLLDPEDEIALYTFDVRDAWLDMDYTRDRTVLTERLSQIDVPSRRGPSIIRSLFGRTPKTGLGIDLGLAKGQEGKNDKKAVMVISDRFKGLGPATVDHVRESGITLVTLNFGNKTEAVVGLGGDLISRRALLNESGGRQFAADGEETGTISHAVVRALKQHYTLGYLTTIAPGDDQRRKLEVSVPGRNFEVRARRSFVPPR